MCNNDKRKPYPDNDALWGACDMRSVIYDARGNGGGGISPTITGDHQNRITDYTAVVVEVDEEKDESVRSHNKGER